MGSENPSDSSPVDFAELSRRLVSNAFSPDAQREAEHAERNRERSKREAERRAALAVLARSLGRRYSRESVSTYKAANSAQKSILARVDAIAGRVRDVVSAGQDVLFLGSVGTGKDHLLARLLYAAVDAGLSVVFLSGQELFARLRGSFDGGGESERKIVADLARPDVLAISDPIPPAGDLSAWRREVLFRVIDARYRDQRSTWLTCNARDSAEGDQAFSEPVWDRLQHGAEILVCEWESFRATEK